MSFRAYVSDLMNDMSKRGGGVVNADDDEIAKAVISANDRYGALVNISLVLDLQDAFENIIIQCQVKLEKQGVLEVLKSREGIGSIIKKNLNPEHLMSFRSYVSDLVKDMDKREEKDVNADDDEIAKAVISANDRYGALVNISLVLDLQDAFENIIIQCQVKLEKQGVLEVLKSREGIGSIIKKNLNPEHLMSFRAYVSDLVKDMDKREEKDVNADDDEIAKAASSANDRYCALVNISLVLDLLDTNDDE